MPDRLTSLDASFLYLEEPTTAMHTGSVMIFEPSRPSDPGVAGGLDYDALVALISARIAFVPRYRQRVREVPGHLGNPVWVDDEQFDVTYHIRRSALPRPGTDEQLQEFVARIQPRVLDRRRPLWEVYLVEGLANGRFALVTKAHQALVDGDTTVDIGHLILDELPQPAPLQAPVEGAAEPWLPAREPGDIELVADALLDVVRRPSKVLDTVRGGVADVQAVGGRVLSGVGGLVATLARTAARPAPPSPLNAEIGTARRWVMVGSDLEDFRRVRAHLSIGGGTDSSDDPPGEPPLDSEGDPPAHPAPSADSRYAATVTVNDVILATVAGGLRAWLLARGEGLHTASTVRAMVPISVYDTLERHDGGDETGAGGGAIDPARIGNRVTASFVDLPVGEPSASMRLHRIAFAMRQQTDIRRMVGAESIAGIAGFAPPTLHALGARLGSAMSRRLFNLVITNVPGPQEPRYVADARMVSTYPVMPLAKGQALAIGLTSYDGGVYFGLNGDRDAMPDLDVLGQCLVEALAELVQTRGDATARQERR